MNTAKEISTWLKANLGKSCTAPLTSTDVYALVASVALCPLIAYEGAPRELFQAYAAIVGQMQSHTRGLAYHAIAFSLDWGHREMIWRNAGLLERPKTRCLHEPSLQTQREE